MSELAILGGPKTRTEPYPEWPVWDERDVQAVTDDLARIMAAAEESREP